VHAVAVNWVKGEEPVCAAGVQEVSVANAVQLEYWQVFAVATVQVVPLPLFDWGVVVQVEPAFT
jgi:hypothetical protein